MLDTIEKSFLKTPMSPMLQTTAMRTPDMGRKTPAGLLKPRPSIIIRRMIVMGKSFFRSLIIISFTNVIIRGRPV